MSRVGDDAADSAVGGYMKFYKRFSQFRRAVKRYISSNGIRCRYAGWVGMACDVDLVRVDGRIRYFSMSTGKEIRNEHRF